MEPCGQRKGAKYSKVGVNQALVKPSANRERVARVIAPGAEQLMQEKTQLTRTSKTESQRVDRHSQKVYVCTCMRSVYIYIYIYLYQISEAAALKRLNV